MKKLPRSFYSRPTLRVARDLLGKLIVRKLNSARLIGKIVEVEAYLGEKDPASHAYRGKTLRNEVMFGRPGHLYVYFTYGMHFCANIVTERNGKAGAALVRAIEPLEEIEAMRKLRERRNPSSSHSFSHPFVVLTNGPAKFCEAFGIGRKENGTDLLGDEIYLMPAKRIPGDKIGRSPRIGVKAGTRSRWRFLIKGNPWVSK